MIHSSNTITLKFFFCLFFPYQQILEYSVSSIEKYSPPPQKEVSWVWHLTTSDGELWGVGSTSSLSLHPGPFWPGVVVSVRVPSVGQIDLDENGVWIISIR